MNWNLFPKSLTETDDDRVILPLSSHPPTNQHHLKQVLWKIIFLIKYLKMLFSGYIWNEKEAKTWSPIVNHRIPWRPKLGGHDPSENSCSSTLSYRRIALVHYIYTKFLSIYDRRKRVLLTISLGFLSFKRF